MKYKLEFHPNPDCVSIHLQKRLCTDIEMFDSPEDKIIVWENDEIVGEKDPPDYIKRLWGVPGVAGITIQHYDLMLTKGAAFDWNDMLSQIIAILNFEFYPDSKPEMLGEPKLPSEELIEHLRQQGCEV